MVLGEVKKYKGGLITIKKNLKVMSFLTMMMISRTNSFSTLYKQTVSRVSLQGK